MYILYYVCVCFHACIGMFVVIPFKNHHFFIPPPSTNCINTLAVRFFFVPKPASRKSPPHRFFLLSLLMTLSSRILTQTHAATISNKKKKKVCCVFLTFHPGIGFPKNFHFEKMHEKVSNAMWRKKRRRPNIKLQLLCRRYFLFAFESSFFSLLFSSFLLSLAFAWLNENFLNENFFSSVGIYACVCCRFSFHFV